MLELSTKNVEGFNTSSPTRTFSMPLALVDQPPVSDSPQKSLIEEALTRLGQKPNKPGFEHLAARIGLRYHTLYTAWLGHTNLGKAAIRQVENVGHLVQATGELPGTYTTYLRDMPLRLPFIPVLSRAHAGALTSYEELPKDWQEVTATTCRDEHAFGLTIQGDCMEPDFHEGEIAVLTPSSEPVSGDVVVARLCDDSVILRKYTVNDAHGKSFRLTCKNKAADYKPLDLTWEDVVWLYPVHSAVRSVRR